MSATIYADKFPVYFDNAPVIDVVGRLHPIPALHQFVYWCGCEESSRFCHQAFERGSSNSNRERQKKTLDLTTIRQLKAIMEWYSQRDTRNNIFNSGVVYLICALHGKCCAICDDPLHATKSDFNLNRFLRHRLSDDVEIACWS